MFRKVLAISLCLLAIYVVAVEPYRMKLTEEAIPLKKLQKSIRILLLSDLQLRGEAGIREAWILSRLGKISVDLILTTGDLFDTREGMKPAIEFLDQLATEAPTFAILGNWEHWSHVNLSQYKKELERRGITLLVNENRPFEWQAQTLYIIGVNDPSQNLHNLPLALKDVPSDSFKILLAHGPSIFPLARAAGIDLMLAGHSHGGQVRIPFTAPLFLPPGCAPYYYGLYTKEESTMMVTSGVGTSILPIRFWARPEIVVIHASPL